LKAAESGTHRLLPTQEEPKSRRSDTPGKLACFACAFEHLEIAGYEELKRVAERAGDRETVAPAERIAGEERAAAEKLYGLFDRAVDASLDAVGVTG
jgi:ferritin-like metal-binding protein YciE